MKLHLVSCTVAFAVLSILPSPGFSQRASSFNNDISVDFINYFVHNTFSGQLEIKSSSTSSLLARISYYSQNTSSQSGTTTAFGVGGAWRFYVADSRALDGFSIAPVIEVYFLKNDVLTKSATIISIGGDAAYKFFFNQFTVEPIFGLRDGIGGGDNGPPGQDNFTKLYPNLSIYLGWAF